VKDIKVQVKDTTKVHTNTLDVKAYANYAKTTSKENNLFGFGAVNNDDDDVPRGDRGGNRGGRGGANAGRRPQKQVMNMGNDEDFPSL